MNTIIASVVGVVVVAFTWPRKAHLRTGSDQPPPVDNWVTAAQSIVYGFVITIGIAWPVQLLLYLRLNPKRPCLWDSPLKPPSSCTQKLDAISDDATHWALGIGALAAIVLFFWLGAVTRKLVSRVAEAERDTAIDKGARRIATAEPQRDTAIERARAGTIERARADTESRVGAAH